MLILASASPRRQELMRLITDDFVVRTADVDERHLEEELIKKGVAGVSEGLALLKAGSVYEDLTEEEKEDAVVIGADTSVIIGDVILGKPADRDDAERMLRMLSGRAHTVNTGVALISRNKSTTFHVESEVVFEPLDAYQEALIERYISTDEPYDKAGAYGIQGGGALLVKKIDGDYFNVVGLPVARLARELEKFVTQPC